VRGICIYCTIGTEAYVNSFICSNQSLHTTTGRTHLPNHNHNHNPIQLHAYKKRIQSKTDDTMLSATLVPSNVPRYPTHTTFPTFDYMYVFVSFVVTLQVDIASTLLK